jgi:predicted ATP-dependent Lon-type protease
MNKDPCLHTELRCKCCLRDGDAAFFTRDSVKADGWEILPSIEQEFVSQLELIALDAISEHFPDVPMENISFDWNFDIYYQIAEDVEDLEEEIAYEEEGSTGIFR